MVADCVNAFGGLCADRVLGHDEQGVSGAQHAALARNVRRWTVDDECHVGADGQTQFVNHDTHET